MQNFAHCLAFTSSLQLFAALTPLALQAVNMLKQIRLDISPHRVKDKVHALRRASLAAGTKSLSPAIRMIWSTGFLYASDAISTPTRMSTPFAEPQNEIVLGQLFQLLCASKKLAGHIRAQIVAIWLTMYQGGVQIFASAILPKGLRPCISIRFVQIHILLCQRVVHAAAAYWLTIVIENAVQLTPSLPSLS